MNPQANNSEIAELRIPQHVEEKIALTAATVERLQASWPQEVVLRAGAASIYDYFPYLFLEAFPAVDPMCLQPFTVAARLFASSIFLHDKVYDEVMGRTPTAHLAQVNALRILAMQWEAYRQLHQIFPPTAAFWDHLHSYLSDFAHACVAEQRFVIGNQPWREYTEMLALAIASGKNGIARATVAGLAELAQDDHLLQPLAEAINRFNIANQMWDDLFDWQADLQTGTPSLLLTRILHERPAIDDPEELKKVTQQVGRAIYYEGHARYVLELALASLYEADRLTDMLPDLPWRLVNADLQQRCLQLLQDIERIVAQNLRRVCTQPQVAVTLPPAKTAWQQIAWDGLAFLIEQWRLGFGEARHIMVFPRAQGFSADQEYQHGDVFQRAIIADALCDANEHLDGQLQPLIDYEIKYLLSQRCVGSGGWSYFPNLPELPPDADDLAQVMQLLLHSGRCGDVLSECEPLLTTLLKDNSHADGSFETWIIPATDRTAEQERQAHFARWMWGLGADNDVMANLLYTLALYDQPRFAEAIQRGIGYLESRQESDGSWRSTWYHGPYYGVFVCLRLLLNVSVNSPGIQPALQFLRSQQHGDGGWGMEGESDPLNTAFALLGLATAQRSRHAQADDAGRSKQALIYLQCCREADQGWPECEFIQMAMGRATGEVRRILSYGSRTITTIFVVKAALAWHGLAA